MSEFSTFMVILELRLENEKMSTNKPMFGLVVLESVIFS